MGFNQLPNTDDVTPIGTKAGRVAEKKLHAKWMLLVPKGANIATAAAAILKATYSTGLLQTTGRWYKTPLIVEGAETTTAAEKKTFTSGQVNTLNDGEYGFDFMFNVENAVMNNLFTLNNKDFDLYIIWNDNIIEGRTDATGTIFYPLRVADFSIDQKTIPFNDIMVVKGSVSFSNKSDHEQYNKILKPTAFLFDELESVREVTIAATATGALYNVTVTVIDESGNGVANLTESLFTVTGGTTSVFSDDGGGTYTFTMTDGTATTYNLVSAALVYAGIDYEFIESKGVTGSVTPAVA